MPRVVIESTGRTLDVPFNATLRDAMLRSEARLYYGLDALTNCGGAARCGTCAVLVVAGGEALSPRTPAETRRLEGVRPEIRLACQAAVRGDCRVHPAVKR